MKTVSEIAKITGLSRRAIRFYDETGLLLPTKISESGYRLYDDKALEILQQILFFKELDVPLKDIKKILDNPNLDKIAKHYGSYENFLDKMKIHVIENTDLIKNMYGSIETYQKRLQGFPERFKNAEIYASKLHEFKLELAKLINEDVKSKRVQNIVAKLDKLMFEFDWTGFKGLDELKKWNLKKFADNKETLEEYKQSIACAEKEQDEKYGEGFSDFWNSAVKYYLENLN